MSGPVSRDEKLLAAALSKLEKLRKAEAFDPINIESKPTAKQLEVINDFGKVKQQWVRAGNQSGKSQTMARLVGWALTGNHPTWKKPAQWGKEPLLIIVAGRTGKQIEDSLLPKIRSFLEEGTYKEVRIGNIIQRLEMENGDRVIFQSLENPAMARERLMSYVAHITWCDELPPTIDLVRELLVRTQARNGYSLFSFTPTVVSTEIQQFVDSIQEPEGKVYRFSMLDNPLYSDPQRKQELLARYQHLSEDMQKAIFEGEWLSSDNSVYYFNYDTMVRTLPAEYLTTWRHVECVDPALKSALGLTIWAEDPKTAKWYCVRADYIKGIYVPTDLVRAVQMITNKYNIIKRISDPHEVWYIQTAASMGITYYGVHRKNERKSELIKQYQEKIGRDVFLTDMATNLIDETRECRYSDRVDGKIVNASSYHLLDSAQYFCDQIPKPEQHIQASSWQDYLYQANEERKINSKKMQMKKERIQNRRNRTTQQQQPKRGFRWA